MKNNKCNNCARKCNIDRNNLTGYCNSTNNLKIAKVMLHHWEEPIISGKCGSGAIFFSNCNLKCVFCQNYLISHNGKGKEISINKLAKIFQILEKKGAHNINLVTPTHYCNEIIEALKLYKPNIPIVWNTNSYESIETINKLKDYVDIFLFDIKYFSDELSLRYSNAKNYFNITTANILEARKFIPEDIIIDGLMKKGIILRHLVLPTHTSDSVKIMQWIKDNLPDSIISLMGQYTPYFKAKDYPEINRKLSKLEYKRVLTMCQNLQLNGYMQELSSADEEYIPNFNEEFDLNKI